MSEILITNPPAYWRNDSRLAPLIDGDGARDYYRSGYFDVARAAALSLTKGEGGNRSAMPILFLFRQYLELALKDALYVSQAFDLRQSDERFGHNLEKLWGEAKRILTAFVERDWLDTVDNIVAVFHSTDKHADAFRYAVNKDGAEHFSGHGAINIEALIAEFDRAHSVIERGISTMRREEREMDRAIREAVARDRT